VFRKAPNKIQDPAKLKRLISDLLDQERWMILSADIKGDAYAGLLERNARDTKSGAGQYFTIASEIAEHLRSVLGQMEEMLGVSGESEN